MLVFILICFHFNINIKIETNHPYTDKDKIPYIPNFLYINDSSSNEILFTHTFLNIISICRDIPEINKDNFEKNHEKVLHKLRENIKLPIPTKKGDGRDLYIHMRSGDMFHKPGWKWSNFYIPPPLRFYYNAIRARAWRNIYIICEDRKNLCLSALIDKYPHVKWRQQSLSEDIKLILSARNIVYGGGTFIPSLLEFNKDVKLIYRVDYALTPINTGIAYRIFNSRAYINALMGEFSNNPHQRYQMINFGFDTTQRKAGFRQFKRLRM